MCPYKMLLKVESRDVKLTFTTFTKTLSLSRLLNFSFEAKGFM